MDLQRIARELLKKSDDVLLLCKMVVYAFITTHQIDVTGSADLSSCMQGREDLQEKQLVQKYLDEIYLTFDDVIELFEALTPSNRQKKYGVVYTPKSIRNYITEQCITSRKPPFVIDPSCGCGSFLLSAAVGINRKYGLSYSEIITSCLYGVDIDEVALYKARLLLSLLARLHGETSELNFHLIRGNFLNPEVIVKLHEMNPLSFDCVIGNPPYVRYRNMDKASKMYLNHWMTAQGGNVDLYMPFFEAALQILKPGGQLGFITPNGYLQAINGKNLRKYLSNQNKAVKIFDFRDNQLFKGVTSYTCITFIYGNNIPRIYYARVSGENFKNIKFSTYSFQQFSDTKPWRMINNYTDKIIECLENSGRPLSSWRINNGLATLKNDVYFFTPNREDDNYYYRMYKGKEYKIEKDICIAVAKPNILKDENDLAQNSEQAIFPYVRKDKNSISLISETDMKVYYPFTYNFLLSCRPSLEARDKGNGNYPAWYAYGRTQGMNNFGKKLLFPYMAGKPIAILSINPELLFYCGYALFSEDVDELCIMKKFLTSKAFWFYMYNTSKPYAKGYMSFAKNYLVRFSIPELSASEKKFLLSENNVDAVNAFIWHKYGIDPQLLNL